jgi:hypothetical protein
MRNNQELRELYIDLGYAVTYLVDKGRGHDSRWGNWHFSLTKSFRPHHDPLVYPDCERNKYQKYLLVVKAAGA